MSDQTYTATYRGTTDRSENTSTRVEIDDHVLRQDVPVSGITADQHARLDALKFHKFEFTEGEGEDPRTRSELVARGQELGGESFTLTETAKKGDLVEAVHALEANQGGQA